MDGDPRSDLIATYIRYLEAERNLSPFTLRNYRADLSQFFAYLEGQEDMAPLAIDRHAFRRYLAWLRQEGTAGASVARKVSTVHSFYRWLARSGRLGADPLLGVRPPKREQRLPGVLSGADIEALIAAADGDSPQALRDRALLELMYAAGARLREVVALDLGNLNMGERSVRVRGKGNKERIVLFGGPAEQALRLYLKKGRPLLARRQPPGSVGEERAPSTGSGQALFLNRDGGRLSARSVEQGVRKCALRAGLDQRVYPHLLRHTFATHLLDGGADLRVVQELMGHARATSTQIYLHVTEAQQRRVYERAFYDEVHRRAGRKAWPERSRRVAK